MKKILQVLSFNTLSKVIVALITILLIRFIPSNEYAQYIFVLSIISIVTQGLLSGVNRIYLLNFEKKVPNLNTKYLSSSFLGFQMALVLIVALILIPTFLLLGEEHFSYLIIMSVIAIGCIEYSKTIFQKNLLFMRFSFVEISRNILFLIGVLLAIFIIGEKELSASNILLIQIISFLIVGIISLRGYINLNQIIRFKEVWLIIKQVFRSNYKLILIYFFILAFFSQLDVLMLKALSTDFQLASYGSAFRYYNILLLALASVHTVIIPMIQKANTIKEIKKIYYKQLKFSILFVPIVVITIILSYWAIPIIDDGKYPEAPIIFTILAISSIISFILSPHSNLLQRFEYYGYLPFSVAIAFVINIILNSVLIPDYGGKGAAIATLISYGIQNGLIFYKSLKIQKEIMSIKD